MGSRVCKCGTPISVASLSDQCHVCGNYTHPSMLFGKKKTGPDWTKIEAYRKKF